MAKINPLEQAQRLYPLPSGKFFGDGTVEGVAQSAFEAGAAWVVEQIADMFDHPEGGRAWPEGLDVEATGPFGFRHWLMGLIEEPEHSLTLRAKFGTYRLECSCGWNSPQGTHEDSVRMREAGRQHIDTKEN